MPRRRMKMTGEIDLHCFGLRPGEHLRWLPRFPAAVVADVMVADTRPANKYNYSPACWAQELTRSWMVESCASEISNSTLESEVDLRRREANCWFCSLLKA